jgi:hypothetical protein
MNNDSNRADTTLSVVLWLTLAVVVLGTAALALREIP